MHLIEFPLLFLVPVLPLVGAAYAGLFGARLERRWGEKVVYLPTVALPWASFVIVCLAWFQLIGAEHDAVLYQRLWSWFDVGQLKLEVAFTVDHLTAVMCGVVTFVGSLIHVYSIGYMKGDPSHFRFFSYLNLFLFSMLVLVLADNLLLVFVGWEGVGLCSYLLISFWYTDLDKAAAGMKAFLVNRVGDAGFLLGVALLFWSLAGGSAGGMSPGTDTAPQTSLRFREIEQILSDPARLDALASQRWLGLSVVTVICLLFFLGAMGKSAQLPLHVWLPDAMAGPTPVSALIHAATMVTAGIYLLARMHFLLALSPVAMTVVAIVGAVTALFAATIGLFQHDIKKVLAYSTVSQLGFMFVAVGAGAFWVAVFHLMTHALFKACLFLGSGSVILGCHHEQDMRKMGGLRKLMPVTAVTYLLSCFAIAGFPLFSGFFSKDEILWRIFDSGNVLLPLGGLLPWLLATLAATCTSFYVFRSYYMTFSGSYRGGTAAHAHADDQHQSHSDDHGHGAQQPHESPRVMTVPLLVLAALATVGGFVGLPTLWHLPNAFEAWLEPVFGGSLPHVRSADYGHVVEWALMALATTLALGGFLLARWLYRNGTNPIPARLQVTQQPLLSRAYRLIYNKYYVDELYDVTLVRRGLDLARVLAWVDGRVVDGIVNLVGWVGRVFSNLQGFIDRRFVDGLVNLVGDVIIGTGRRLRTVQNGRIQSYVVGLLAGSVLVVYVAYVAVW